MSDDEQKIENEAEEREETEEQTGGDEADRLAELARELEEVRQHVLYAQAETQNVRRRLEQEKLNAAQYAATGFARDMLSVKDNLERALMAIADDLREQEHMKGLVAGIEATGRELDKAFERHGITPIEALGQKLDPNKHQAMIEIPDDSVEPGTIVEEMQSGYMIKDRLLRPALVGVAKKPN